MTPTISRNLHRTAASTARRRARPALEMLEDRRLPTASLLATALDAAGNPAYFAIGTGGAVTVNVERPTNDVNVPYRYSGPQTLAGLQATSIGAFTFPNGDPAVVAMTGPQSYLYVNRYSATGDPAKPRAWTGWEQFGTFVATSFEAVSNGTTGAAIFAIGADSQVYEAPYDPSTTATTPATAWSGFQILPGPGAASISVVADGAATYEVTALGGPQSFVQGNTVTETGGVIQPTGWSQLGSFVATSLNVTPGVNTTAIGTSLGDRLFLFAVGTAGDLFFDPLTLSPSSIARVSTVYTTVGDITPINGKTISSTAIVEDGYMTVVALTSDNDIYANQVTATGLTAAPLYFQGWYVPNNSSSTYSSSLGFSATALSSIGTGSGGLALVSQDTTGVVRVSQAAGHDPVSFPGYGLNDNYYSFWNSLATQNNAIATGTGPNGLPIVVGIASSGQVYANIDTAGGTGGAADTYSGFTALPGLTATSIAATTEPNGFAVFALAGQLGYVFENQYLASGNSTTPFAWTGWQQLGSLVFTSIAAATPAGSTSTGQATVFGLGEDGLVYAAGATAQGTDSTLATFTPLTGLYVGSFSVKSVGSQILVAALTGPVSYAYADLYTPAAGSTVATAAGWQSTGPFVYYHVYASTTPTGAPAVSGFTYYYGSKSTAVYTQSIDGTAASNDAYLQFGIYLTYQPSSSYYNTATAFGALTDPGGQAVTYLALNTGYYYYQPGVYQSVVLPSGNSGYYTYSPIDPSLTNILSLAISTDRTSQSYFVGDSDGQVYVSTVTAVGSTSSATAFSNYVSVGTLPS